VIGELVYAGSHPKFNLDGVRDKVVLVDFAINTREWAQLYQRWGVNPPDEPFPSAVRPARAAVTDLTPFQKAGAVGVILAWTDVSDANAAEQYTPFSRPPQGIPGLYVGRDTGAQLRKLAGSGARATVVLEDGAIGILALARYFSRIPKTERQRTLVFPLTTGHFASAWVPSIRGVIDKHPDVIKKAVAALTVEHLGCREWMDDASFNYGATGKNEWSIAITPLKSMGQIMVDALKGSLDRAAAVNPVNGGWLGEGESLSRAGVPAIGYIPQPNYLLVGAADGCIGKLSPELLHSQIQVFAKVIHKIDTMTAASLK
jgi:hypothetical protein